MFFKFVWNGSEKVKRTTLINNYENGGLKMINLKIYIDSLKISWLEKLSSNEKATWKVIPLFTLNTTHLGIDILKSNCNFEDLNHEIKSKINILPFFYHKLLTVWFSTTAMQDINNIENWNDQLIWNNSFIVNDNKTLYFKKWAKKGVNLISDLYNVNKNFKSWNEIKTVFKNDGTAFLDYLALRQALPQKWKQMATQEENHTTIGFYFNENYIDLDKCTTQLYRKIMLSKMSSRPICQNRWENELHDVNIDWNNVWKRMFSDITEPRLKTLNWKVISNIYPTKVFLKKIKKEENNICETCDKIDYTEHFFFECKQITKIWEEVEKLLLQIYDLDLKINKKYVMFGYEDVNLAKEKQVNVLLSVAKLCISKFRYGNYPNMLSLLYFELKTRKIMQ